MNEPEASASRDQLPVNGLSFHAPTLLSFPLAHETIDRIVVLYFPDEIDAAVNLSFSFRTPSIS